MFDWFLDLEWLYAVGEWVRYHQVLFWDSIAVVGLLGVWWLCND